MDMVKLLKLKKELANVTKSLKKNYSLKLIARQQKLYKLIREMGVNIT